MKIVYLSLGSNLGDRRANLEDAIKQLDAPDLRIVKKSSIHETEPRDLPDQPWFLNQVVQAETSLFPRRLLARLKNVERTMGRTRTVSKGPRRIDLDILFFGNAILSTPDLEIPHPRLTERRFVLEPLAEIAPDLRHPRTGRTAREMLARVMDQAVRRV